MRARTFRVPFSRVAPEAVELEWGPDDYIVVRPIFTRSPGELAALKARLFDDSTDEERRPFLMELLHSTVTEWSLRDSEGATVQMPQTWDEVDALPYGLAMSLFSFLYTYRGDGSADPSPAAQPS